MTGHPDAVAADPGPDGSDEGGVRPDGADVIRVLIVDDHDMFASSLAVVLGAEDDMRVVGTAGTARAAVDKAGLLAPDVILLDQRLPDGDGVALIGPLLAVRTDLQVVMLTASTSDHILVSAIEAGAAGFIDKSRSVAEVVSAVRSAAAGESLVSPKLLARLLPRLRRQEGGRVDALTEREREVLGYLADGLSNADIAAKMTVSVHTVRNHIVNLSAKLGAHSKLEALAIAVRKGLISY
ncbi:response regulator transcription factor [soil metagenome]|jgi:DNA-binding NarL/FixJ family response regulator